MRPSKPDLVIAVSSVAYVAIAWLTWLKVGESSRNSYEIFRSAQRLNLEALDPLRFAWFFVPVVTLVVLVCMAVGYRRSAAALALVQSAFVGAIGLIVLISGVESGLGPIVAVAAGALGASFSFSVLFFNR